MIELRPIRTAGEIAAAYTDDFKALGAQSVEAVDDGVKVTFGTDDQRYPVMEMLRDEINGVKLIGDHRLESGHAPTPTVQDVFARVGALAGVADVEFTETAKGAKLITVKVDNQSRAHELRQLLREKVGLDLPQQGGLDSMNSWNQPPVEVPVNVQTNGIYG